MLLMLSLIAVSIGFGMLLYAMAQRRGNNPVIWAVLGFAFGPLAMPFLYLTPKPKNNNGL